MYSASCESRKGSHSSVRRKSFMWERIWNRVKCLHEKESDTRRIFHPSWLKDWTRTDSSSRCGCARNRQIDLKQDFNCHKIGLVPYTNGCRFIVFEHQYGRRDVLRKRSVFSMRCFTAQVSGYTIPLL